MCEAEVGDEQKYEDPTVNLLQEMVADLLGKEAAVFLPSGTMCNEIALRVHCRPGRGDAGPPHRASHPLRDRRPRRAGRRQRPPARRRARPVRRRRAGGGHPPRLPPLPAQPAGVGRADQQPRRRLDLAAGPRARGDRGRAPPPPGHAPGRRPPDERGRRQRRRRPRVGGALRLGVDRLHQGPRARRSAPRWPARATSSPRRGGSSSRWAAPCARPASSPPAASTRSATTSSAWPRTTPTPAAWPRGWPRCRA